MVTVNQKCSNIIDTRTKQERNPNVTLKMIIKSQGNRAKEEQKTTSQKAQTQFSK